MTAIIKIGIIDRRTLVVKLCCYKPGITAQAIKQIMNANSYISGVPFYSEHDPEKVSELRRLGMVVYFANKGEKSEWNGILKCQEFDVNYIYDVNLVSELTSYQ